MLFCSICSEQKGAVEIKNCAETCAARKYIQIEDTDNSDTDENDSDVVEKKGPYRILMKHK